MEKRYQVFISSTFEDLKEERQAVLRAVLELNHMPAGMELFPAADDEAWQLIKDVIDASDYYVLIIGGRYGSLDETGIGYTEKEYDYAVETSKPVIPLLHKNPDNLPREKTDTDEAIWKRLLAFRDKAEKRHTCVYWETVDDLKAKVIVGITTAVKRKPTIGWVRADQVPSDATITELLVLKKRIAELEKDSEKERTTPPKGTEELVQGNDIFEIDCEFLVIELFDESYYSPNETSHKGRVGATWNQIFATVAPQMINEMDGYSLQQKIENFFITEAKRVFKEEEELKDKQLKNFKFKDNQIETCVIQFRALGLIRQSIKQRSVKDIRTYWTLTPYGDTVMVQERAIRKNHVVEETTTKSKLNGNKNKK